MAKKVIRIKVRDGEDINDDCDDFRIDAHGIAFWQKSRLAISKNSQSVSGTFIPMYNIIRADFRDSVGPEEFKPDLEPAGN